LVASRTHPASVLVLVLDTASSAVEVAEHILARVARRAASVRARIAGCRLHGLDIGALEKFEVERIARIKLDPIAGSSPTVMSKNPASLANQVRIA